MAGSAKRKLFVRPTLGVVVLVGAAACAGAGQPGHTFEIVEEDGVPVAVSTAVPRFDGELFTYERVLVLRPDPDNPETFLYEPFTFTLADDGNYYVADRGNHRVAVFNAEGEFVRAFGRQGDGPGELRDPMLIQARGDKLLVNGDRTRSLRQRGPSRSSTGTVSTVGSSGGPASICLPSR